jgi:hypothetical protein
VVASDASFEATQTAKSTDSTEDEPPFASALAWFLHLFLVGSLEFLGQVAQEELRAEERFLRSRMLSAGLEPPEANGEIEKG